MNSGSLSVSPSNSSGKGMGLGGGRVLGSGQANKAKVNFNLLSMALCSLGWATRGVAGLLTGSPGVWRGPLGFEGSAEQGGACQFQGIAGSAWGLGGNRLPADCGWNHSLVAEMLLLQGGHKSWWSPVRKRVSGRTQANASAMVLSSVIQSALKAMSLPRCL